MGFLSFRVKSDLAASIEIAVGLASLYEVGSAVINGSSEIIPVENDRDKIITDLRPGVQVRVKMKRYSLVPAIGQVKAIIIKIMLAEILKSAQTCSGLV